MLGGNDANVDQCSFVILNTPRILQNSQVKIDKLRKSYKLTIEKLTSPQVSPRLSHQPPSQFIQQQEQSCLPVKLLPSLHRQKIVRMNAEILGARPQPRLRVQGIKPRIDVLKSPTTAAVTRSIGVDLQ